MSITNSGMTRTLFVTPQYMMDNTVVNDNADPKLIVKAIRTAEDKYILPIIGGMLYNTIIDKIQTGALLGNYKNLVDRFIIPATLEYATYEYVPYVYKFRNKGISKQTSETSEPVDRDDLYFIRENILQTAQFYGEQLINFLRANSTLFPEYCQYQNDQVKPARGDYFSGIHIPSSNRNSDDNIDGLGITYNVNL